jgi:hypothetical protein
MLNNDLYTLRDKKKFTIITVTDSKIVIRVDSSKKTRPIIIQEIKGALSALQSSGILSRTQIEERFSPRNPAYVASILSKWPGVHEKLDPYITLFYKSSP